MQMKTCSKCGVEKEFDRTAKKWSKASGFYGLTCWSCHLIAGRTRAASYRATPIGRAKLVEAAATWYAKNKPPPRPASPLLTTKVCVRCGVEKDLTEWPTKYGEPTGGKCRPCHNEASVAGKLARKQAAGWEPKAPSWKAGNRAWERYQDARNKMKNTHIPSSSQKWYAALVQATPNWLSPEQWREMGRVYAQARSEGLTVDHEVPLVGKDENGRHVVSGLHVPWNLGLLTNVANALKGNSYELG